jgi:single-stranded-DNA-specific exonuclease
MKLLEKLLAYCQLSEKELEDREAEVNLESLKDPFSSFLGYKEALGLIKAHLAAQDKIAVYGDYDVDGMTSTAILVQTFLKLGVKPGFFIPSRYKEGYGLTPERAGEFAAKGYKLLITVDNGISAFPGLAEAEEAGLDVLVIDHHTPEAQLPAVQGIIHPSLGKYADYNISAAFLALLVSYGLLGSYDPYLASLAGLGVFSDVMPLKGMNLLLAKHLCSYAGSGSDPHYAFLLSGKKGRLTSRDVSFLLVSPLNALGRVDIGLRNNDGVRFLVSSAPADIVKYGSEILQVSAQKKNRVKDLRQLLDTDGDPSSPLEVSFASGLEVGLAGSLASALADKLKKPCFVFTEAPEDPELLVGSGRSPDYLDLYQLVAAYKDSYVAFGGHKQALGLTIHKKDLLSLQKQWAADLAKLGLKAPEPKAIALELEDLSFSGLKTLRRFEPFGNGFPEPLFALKTAKERLRFSHDGRHLFMDAGPGAGAVYFNYPKALDQLPDEPFYLLGHLEEDSYQGASRVRLNGCGYLRLGQGKLIQ